MAEAVSKEEYLKLELLHKPARKKFPRRRKVYVPHKDHTWAADLVDMRSFATKNRGYKWIINIIDVWSRYAWSVPMKSKNAADTLQAVRDVIDSFGESRNSFGWTKARSSTIVR
jgi:transposase InsO family protein